MGRNVAEFAGEWAEVVPDVTIDGWSNLSDPEPVRWEVHPMSAAEDSQFRRRIATSASKGNDIARTMDLMRDILTARVRNVRNYRVRGQDITTGAELAAHGEQEFVIAAWQSVTEASKLDEALKKTSDWRSVFLPPETQL